VLLEGVQKNPRKPLRTLNFWEAAALEPFYHPQLTDLRYAYYLTFIPVKRNIYFCPLFAPFGTAFSSNYH
jgi:hypothetical protein